MTKSEKIIEIYIDEIVKRIDYDIWKGGYNEETAEEPEFVKDNRQEIFELLHDMWEELES